jgi:hypothetical protein
MENRGVRFAIRCYEGLLCLYPREFRRRHAAQMACVFAECCEEEWRSRGSRGLLILAASTLHDLTVSAAAERGSAFVSELNWDRRVLSGTPGFRAASAIVFTICLGILGMVLSGALSHAQPWQRVIFLSGACLNVGALWAVSVFLSAVGRFSLLFVEKVRAFRHLSGVALRLLIIVSAAASIPAIRAVGNGKPYGHVPPLWQVAIFPLLLLLLVSVFFLLDPLLSTNRDEKRWRGNQLRLG